MVKKSDMEGIGCGLFYYPVTFLKVLSKTSVLDLAATDFLTLKLPKYFDAV